ncbi:HAD family hydrolase [Chloroflexota bacterium]
MSKSRLEAVIWDMDGVIADTAPYHFKAWQMVFPKRGVGFTREDFKHHFGQRDDTIISDTFGGRISAGEIEEIALEKEETFRREVAPNVKPFPGAIELIRSLKERGVKTAIASSAPMENIQLLLGNLGVIDFFQAIVSGREVTEGKPSPQAFLLAAKRLEVKPENCVVFEDAVAGVAAARRAGMKCLAVTNNHSRASLMEADLIVDSLENVSIDNLVSLFDLAEED